MPTDFTFALPGGRLEVQPVLRVTGAFDRRTYVLLFDLDRSYGEALDGSSLPWSDSLGSLFRYVPAASAPGVVHVDGFVMPPHVDRLRIRVRAWNTSEPPPVEDLAIATALGGQPAIIFAERT